MQQLAVTDLADFCAAQLAAGTAPVLLDVREAWEVALAAIHVDGATALHIPMGEVPRRLAEIDRTRPVVCICHHGMRSAQVVAFLAHQGAGPVYNLAGGVDAWSARVDPAVARY